MNKAYILFAYILLSILLPTSNSQICQEMVGGCSSANCINNICQACDNATNDVASNCNCPTGQFHDGSACLPCHASCQNCSGPLETECKSCDPTIEGLGFNSVDFMCQCMPGYLADGDGCVRCYSYGKECTLSCPKGTRANEKYMQCENDSDEDIENDDDTLYIIVTICLIILIILLMVLLYNYFAGVFSKIFAADKDKVLPLNEEEKFYLANQQELERQRRLREEEIARQLALEEQQRLEEEEKRRKQLEEEERLRKEEEERLRLEAEEAERRRQEEERLRLEAEAEALRQLELERERQRREEEERLRLEAEEAERRRREEEERLRLEAEEQERLRREAEEEAERQRLAAEEAARLAREEAERLERERLERERLEAEARAERERLEAEERERQRLKELARQARQNRMMERQLTRQSTMAANEEKLRKMREERARLESEKREMEDYNEKCLKEADGINSHFGDIASRMERARLRRQETMSIKQNILQRQATIAEQKRELDAALEGVDFGAALAKVKDIKEEDVVFLQNLRKPPERIQLCLEAVITVLSNSTKKISWDDIKKEISNINFRRNMLTFDPESISDKVFNKVKKEYTNNPQWNLTKIHKASVAAGCFANWLDAVIKFKQIKLENKPLFDKIKALQTEEKAMAGDVEKLDELDEEEKKFEQEQKDMEGETEEYKSKQKTLQKQATLNLGDIQERVDKINNMKSDELSLQAIDEDEEESEIDSDIDMETLKAIQELK